MLMGCVRRDAAQHQQRHGARARCGRHPDAGRAEAGCCGAVRLHLGDHDGLDTCGATSTPVGRLVPAGAVEAIVMNASGCGAMVKEYGHSLRHDPAMPRKYRIADLTARDLSELLPDIVAALRTRLATRPKPHWPSIPPLRCSTDSSCAVTSVASARAPASTCRSRSTKRICAAARPSHLLAAAARAGDAAARSQAGATRGARARSRDLSQYRLHPASAERHHDAGAALGRGARRRARIRAIDRLTFAKAGGSRSFIGLRRRVVERRMSKDSKKDSPAGSAPA